MTGSGRNEREWVGPGACRFTAGVQDESGRCVMRRIGVRLTILGLFIGTAIAVSSVAVRADPYCDHWYSVCIDSMQCCPTPWDPSQCSNMCVYHEAEDECFCQRVQ